MLSTALRFSIVRATRPCRLGSVPWHISNCRSVFGSGLWRSLFQRIFSAASLSSQAWPAPGCLLAIVFDPSTFCVFRVDRWWPPTRLHQSPGVLSTLSSHHAYLTRRSVPVALFITGPLGHRQGLDHVNIRPIHLNCHPSFHMSSGPHTWHCQESHLGAFSVTSVFAFSLPMSQCSTLTPGQRWPPCSCYACLSSIVGIDGPSTDMCGGLSPSFFAGLQFSAPAHPAAGVIPGSLSLFKTADSFDGY